MFCLMKTHKVYMVFVLQADDRTMLHCFYNDSCNTVAVIDRVFILICAKADLCYQDNMNAHKTENLMVYGSKIFVFGHENSFLFLFLCNMKI